MKSGNLQKYETKNPLKRIMLDKFQTTMIQLFERLLHITQLAQYEKIELCDIGCGEGMIDGLLKQNFSQIHITGYDLSEQAIAYAKKQNPEFDYSVKNIFSENSEKIFPIVLCTEVLEHLDRPEHAFNILLNTTKNVLVVTVPHEPYFCLGNFLSGKNISRWGNPPDHINHWTKKKFQRWINGQTNRKVEFFYSFPWQGAVIYIDEA